MLPLFITFLLIDLTPLADNQQVHLNQTEFRLTVNRCTVGMASSQRYCECVIRGFEMFLPIEDWDAVRRGGHILHRDIAYQIDQSCQRAAPK